MSKSWLVLCSTGAFTRERSNFPDYRAILQYGPTLDVEGLELLFYHQWYEQFDQVAADFLASGLRFPVIHAEKSISPALGSAEPEQRAEALRKLRENCRLGQQLGVELLVLHLWGLPGSDEQLERNLSLLGEGLQARSAWRRRWSSRMAGSIFPSCMPAWLICAGWPPMEDGLNRMEASDAACD